MQRRSLELVPSAVIVVIVMAVYLLSAVRLSYDSAYSIPLALSIIRDGDIRLDEYQTIIPANDYRIFNANGHMYSGQTFGSSLAAVPFVAMADWWYRGQSLDFQQVLLVSPPLELERFIASVFLVAALIVLYHVARHLEQPRTTALLLVLILAFGTAMWSVFSRSFWTHGPAMFALSLVLLLLLRAPQHPQQVIYLAPLFVYLYFTRPNLALISGVFTIYLFSTYRPYFLRFAAAAVISAAPIFALNWFEFGQLTTPYYSQFMFNDSIIQATAAQFISPNRGLFIYSPFLVFFLGGVIFKLRQRQFVRLDSAILVAMLGTTAIYSVWWAWHSGHSYGNRFLADLLPFFFYWLVYFMSGLKLLRPGWVQSVVALLFVVSIMISIAINGIGALYWEGWRWNNYPVNVLDQPERVWDWSDPAFLRFLIVFRRDQARQLAQTGDFPAAVAVLTDLLRYEPYNTELLNQRGQAFLSLHQCSNAGADFRFTLALEPSNQLAQTALAQSCSNP